MKAQSKILSATDHIYYPESDGQPLAENTIQLRWIFSLYMNLRLLFRNKEVFVATDLFWYPVEGDNKTKVAPDVMVVFGRPDKDRGSYKQWEEEGIVPQVVMEILSPGNSPIEMARKLMFYDTYGVEEYIMLDPEHEAFFVYERVDGKLTSKQDGHVPWQSSRLMIWLEVFDGKLRALMPDKAPFDTPEALKDQLEAAEQKVEAEKRRADQAEAENERLRQRLKELGMEE